MKTTYFVRSLKLSNGTGYTVTHERKHTNFRSYTELVHYMRKEIKHSLKIGFAPVVRADNGCKSIEEDAFSYEY